MTIFQQNIPTKLAQVARSHDLTIIHNTYTVYTLNDRIDRA